MEWGRVYGMDMEWIQLEVPRSWFDNTNTPHTWLWGRVENI